MSLAVFIISAGDACSQNVLRKLREQAESEVIKKVFGEEQETETPSSQTPSSPGMSNTTGGGLTTTPPDVKENIQGAQTAMASGKYTDARYSARQALMGVELEMGWNVINNLPSSVSGLDAVKEEDRVGSTGIGFVGLMIERVYRSKNQELRLSVGNNAVLLTGVNMYVSSGTYATTEDNQKVIQFQGHRSVIEYNEGSGYTLSVPFGQSSIMVVNGVNFASEQAFMDAANKFNLEKIKKELGEK